MKPNIRRFVIAGLILLLCILACAIWVWLDTLQEGRENRSKGSFYELTLENDLPEQVLLRVVTTQATHEYPMRPCSVFISGIMGPNDGTIGVNAVSTDGSLLDSGQLQLPGGSALRQLHIQIPLNGATECPSPASGQYGLTLANSLSREVVLSLDSVEIGRVAALSKGTFGPLPGTWEAVARRIEIRSGGHILIRPMYADYDLGQVPHFFIDID